MTTLIDRIMNNQKMIQIVNQLQIGDDDIIRQILEAELTAVKVVDELEAQLNQAQNNAEIWTAIWAIYDYLKQTSVAKEDVGEMGKHIMLQPGEYYKDEFRNIITYEDEQKEMLKDSQPKEVTQSISREAVVKLREQKQKEINNIGKYDIVEHEQGYYEGLVEGKQDEIKDLDQLLISNP